MKIPLTDKFLLDIYTAIESIGRTIETPEVFRVRTFREMCEPERCKFWRDYRRKRQRKQFNQFIDYLKRKGYIKIKSLEGKKGILLTPKGKEKALAAKYKSVSGLKKRKDKKWIMVMYDIPETSKRYRNYLRGFLCGLGFKKLQQSVWVSPYDVYQDLEEIIRIYVLDKFVKIFLVEEVEI